MLKFCKNNFGGAFYSISLLPWGKISQASEGCDDILGGMVLMKQNINSG